jgi:hypothetical protein
MKRVLLAISVLVFAACRVSAAIILASESFDTSSSNWGDRDPLKMIVDFAVGSGDPAGSLHGSFASQGSPSFESDAFRASASSNSSGGAFTGNLRLSYTNFTDVRFAFYAADVLPSTFIFRIGDGVNTFSYNVKPQLNAAATWTTVDVPLTYGGGWIGGSAAQFLNIFNNVAFVDVQVGRNNTGAQNYFLDNFSLLDAATVPEPNSILLLLFGGVMFRAAYKRRRARALRVGHALQ